MFADDLVVIGGGRLLAAESLGAIIAGNDTTVTVETRQPDELVKLLSELGIRADANGNRLVVHGTSKDRVSDIAFDNQIRLVEIMEPPGLSKTLCSK